jgi:hypothetical protein
MTLRLPHGFYSVLLALGVSVLAQTSLATPARASIIDLTGAVGDQGTVNGAIFRVDTPTEAAGTGTLNTFVQLDPGGSTPVERGINTSGRPSNYGDFDAKNSGTHNYNIQFGQLGIRRVNGVPYVEFLLDANESKNAADKYLSMDAFQVYTSPTASLFSSTFTPAGNELGGTLTGLGTLRYNLDAGADSTLLLDEGLIGSGSGRADMTVLVPASAFAGALPTDYLYIYSHFGSMGTVTDSSGNSRNYGASAGFEEWARPVNPSEVFPEPATVGMLLGGGIVLLVRRRRR